ncbi:MAG: HDOD domain-containing protein [Pseudomonadota bacterium]
MDKRAIHSRLAADAAQGELAFPTSARVAMKLRQTLADPDCPMETVARLVQAEPLLSARVVAMANSVTLNPGGRPITDVRAAVMRLGFRTVQTLATALVARQLAGARLQGAEQELAGKLWEHTAHVAALCSVIARRFTHVDAETALFAGILHEVGGFYLLSRAQEFPGLLDGDYGDWLEEGEAEVGRAILKVLAVPDIVVQAVEAYWGGYLAIPPVSLGDTLMIAEDLAPVPSPLHALPDLGAPVPPGGGTGIDIIIGEDALSVILAESAEEVRSLSDALTF